MKGEGRETHKRTDRRGKRKRETDEYCKEQREGGMKREGIGEDVGRE